MTWVEGGLHPGQVATYTEDKCMLNPITFDLATLDTRLLGKYTLHWQMTFVLDEFS